MTLRSELYYRIVCLLKYHIFGCHDEGFVCIWCSEKVKKQEEACHRKS